MREPSAADAGVGDEHLVARVLAGHPDDFAVLMRRCNRRLFRVIRGLVRDDAEAEDACQEAWLSAYRHLSELRHGAMFSTWLCRIGLRCALARSHDAASTVTLDDPERLAADLGEGGPEAGVDRRRLGREVEHAIDGLDEGHRVVLILRDVEHMTTSEAAEVLGLSEENVRVRLHRARTILRRRLLARDLGPAIREAFHFAGERCRRLTGSVMTRLDSLAYSDLRYSTRSA